MEEVEDGLKYRGLRRCSAQCPHIFVCFTAANNRSSDCSKLIPLASVGHCNAEDHSNTKPYFSVDVQLQTPWTMGQWDSLVPCTCGDSPIDSINLYPKKEQITLFLGVYTKCDRHSLGHKKICVVTVRRPTLIFGPDPKLFYGTFSRKLFKCPIFAFQCSFGCLRDHYFDKNELNAF